MKIKLSDYIANFLVENGIKDMFSVTGGGAMHLNDSFGHCKELFVTYNHHEQACAIAAESYTRLTNNIAAVCVTTGPGGTNTLTGVLGGWLDSIPMLIISGQVKKTTTIWSSTLPLRQLGDQEFNIVDCVKSMTKYAVMITNPNEISYHLERSLFLAKNGRPGPCWLDIPSDLQAAIIDTDELVHYVCIEDKYQIPQTPSLELINEIIKKIECAKRPVIYAGNGIRLADAHHIFLKLIDKLGIPVVTPWNSHDLIWNDHPLYCGRPGIMGDRGGNFVVQKSDLIIALGTRLSIRQVSYNWENFAPNAFKIMIDIDPSELFKHTLQIDMPIRANVKDVMNELLDSDYNRVKPHESWLTWCKKINADFPILLEKYKEKGSPVNPYYFIDTLFRNLNEDDTIVCSNGMCCVITFQAAYLKKGQRLYHNSGCASMGYGLPAAIGAAVATKGRIYCLEGDGSIQMNIQELQTVIHHNYDIKIFLMNNNGYHSIRQTQNNIFHNGLVGVSSDNGISFPETKKIANAYGIDYTKVESTCDMVAQIKDFIEKKGPGICEIIIDPEQNFEPKLSSKKMPDGTMISPSLENMAPFLNDEILEEIMKSI